jgi:cell wall assembly regulator SMI1
MDKRLEEIWERIESWDVAHRHPTLGSRLKDPAPGDVVDDLNRQLQLGGKLPVDFLDSLRRHDGTVGWTTEFHQGRLLGVSRIHKRLTDLRYIAQGLLDADIDNGVSVDMTLTATGPVKNE